MKDYFDLDLLLRDYTLDVAELRRAIEATFARRKLALPSDWPVGLRAAFASAPVKQAQWTAFLMEEPTGAGIAARVDWPFARWLGEGGSSRIGLMSTAGC